jgi:hypothetical protein
MNGPINHTRQQFNQTVSRGTDSVVEDIRNWLHFASTSSSLNIFQRWAASVWRHSRQSSSLTFRLHVIRIVRVKAHETVVSGSTLQELLVGK